MEAFSKGGLFNGGTYARGGFKIFLLTGLIPAELFFQETISSMLHIQAMGYF